MLGFKLARRDEMNLDLLAEIRAWEINRAVGFLPLRGRVLEVGAGTGQQAAALARHGFDVTGIELADSLYVGARVFPITNYDGNRIPFPDGSFDAVYSSNVLEHVADLARMHAEIMRVLKPDGRVVHVLPTHHWRLWTSLAAIPLALMSIRHCTSLRQVARRLLSPLRQQRHGERGNVVTEFWYFHPRWWRRELTANGYDIVGDSPMGLFYTGHLLMGGRLGMVARSRLSVLLGSACHVFVLGVHAQSPHPASIQERESP